MKILYTFFIAAFLLLGFSADAQVNMTLTDTEATVVIDGNTTRMDLIEVRTALLERGIDFKYSFQFDNQTRLEMLDFTVSANNGAITGQGIHNNLQASGAKVTFHVNKATGTCTVDMVE